METMPAADTVLAKLADLTSDLSPARIADFLSVRGAAATSSIRVEDGYVTISSSYCVTEGPHGARRVRNIGFHETLPHGLTYAQIVAQVRAHTDLLGYSEFCAIGKGRSY
jgi:hypothetical protein